MAALFGIGFAGRIGGAAEGGIAGSTGGKGGSIGSTGRGGSGTGNGGNVEGKDKRSKDWLIPPQYRQR